MRFIWVRDFVSNATVALVPFVSSNEVLTRGSSISQSKPDFEEVVYVSQPDQHIDAPVTPH